MTKNHFYWNLQSASDVLNQIYKNAVGGIRGNYRSMPTDCPQRDDQNEEGGIPDISPAHWKMYNDNVTWNGTGIMVAEMLYAQCASLGPTASEVSVVRLD
ncbi:MAG: hypothetical protein KAQ79_11785 [Cyclobacteriaceae bacterium]|nr:hypothetical protein [Cyclobacteriaceae bacterium]